MFLPKKVEHIHVLWVTSGQHSCLLLELLSTQKLQLYTVGGGKDQGPTAQVTHLRNQPFLFCSMHLMLFFTAFTCTSTSLPNCHTDQG